MKKNVYTCEMIEDLIPLAAEGICSEESRAAVEAHIADCARCRALYEKPLLPETPQAKAPDEAKTFRKVYRKIAGSRRLNKILGVLLGILAVPLAVLTVGSITKNEVIPSFEGVHQDYIVYRLAKAIAEGNFRPYLQMMQESDDLLYTHGDAVQQAVLDADTASVRAVYDQYASGKKVRFILLHSYYDPAGMIPDHWTGELHVNPKSLRTTVRVYFTDKTGMELEFADLGGGKIGCIGYDPQEFGSGEFSEKLTEALWFAENHKSLWTPFLESCFEKEMQTIPENRESRLTLMANRFAPEYRDRLVNAFRNFYAADYQTPELTVSELHYDEERAAFYYEAALTAADAKGSAVLSARLYESQKGLIPPEQSECRVSTDGCTDALAEALAQYFG